MSDSSDDKLGQKGKPPRVSTLLSSNPRAYFVKVLYKRLNARGGVDKLIDWILDVAESERHPKSAEMRIWLAEQIAGKAKQVVEAKSTTVSTVNHNYNLNAIPIEKRQQIAQLLAAAREVKQPDPVTSSPTTPGASPETEA